MSIPEPVVQAPIIHPHAYDKDTAIQNILKTIRQKHNLPPAASKSAPAAIKMPVKAAPKQAAVRSEIQEI
jgi:hypothetical protein